MPKNYKIIIIAVLILALAAGGLWYAKKITGQNNEKEKTIFNTGFILLDDEKTLVWSEAVALAPEARARFEDKVAEIKADLAVAKEKDQLLADYNNLAVYQKYLGNYRESYGAYLKSLALESQARITWQNFADVLLKIKAYKSAEFAYKKAVELNKYIPESYVKLADYYKAVGNDAQVEATYKSAVETIKQSYESDALVLSAYADWLSGEKRYDEAIKILQELEKKQPENKAAIERKIQVLRSKK